MKKKPKLGRFMVIMEPELHAISQVMAKTKDMSLSGLIRSLLRKELQMEANNDRFRAGKGTSGKDA